MQKSIAKYDNRFFNFFASLFLVCMPVALMCSQYWVCLVPFLFLFIYFSWQRLPFLFTLLLVALPFSFEYNFTPTLGTDLPDEPLMIAVLLLAAAMCIYDRSRVPTAAWNHPITWILLLQLAWIIIVTVLAVQPMLAVKFLLAKVWYLGAFFVGGIIVFQRPKQMKRAATLLAIAMLLAAIIVFIRHSRFGFTFTGINPAAAPFFRNHVTYSSLLVCCIPIFLAMFFLQPRFSWRVVLAGCVLFLLVALLFTYSRGAWLALLAGLIAYLLIRRHLLFKTYLLALFALAGSVFWLVKNDNYLRLAHDYRTTIFHTNFSQHLAATYQLKDISTAERFYRWIAGARMVKEKPLTGFGPAGFYTNYKPYTVPLFRTWVSNNEEHSTVHNYFLLVALEQGLPGLIFFLLLLGAVFYYIERMYNNASNREERIIVQAIGVIIVMICCVNFLSDLVETDKIGSIFYLCIAALVARAGLSSASKPATNIERIS